MRRLATIVMALALGLSISACDPREWFVCSLGVCGYALDDIPPGTPREVAAAGGDRQVRLTWRRTEEPDFFAYHVHRATSAGGPFTDVGSTFEPGYLDTYLLENGTPYFYRVTATDAAGNESAPSVVTSAVPASPPPRPRLGAPVLRAERFFDHIKLEWDGVPGASDYVVYRRTTPDGSYAEIGRGLGFLFDRDVVGGTLYRYVVAAVDPGGAIGETSNEVALSVFANPGPDLGFLLAWGTRGTLAGQFLNPRGIATDPSGSVYVTDNPGELARVQKFNGIGEQLTAWTLPGLAHGIAVGPDSSVFVVNRVFGRVQKYTPAGVFITQWGTFSSPTGIAVDGAGNVYVADTGNQRIQKFTSAGGFVREWAVGAGVTGVATDADGNVYTVSRTAALVSKFTSDGVPVTSWGSEFSLPEGIGVDVADRVFVTDTGNDRMQMFTTDGVLTYVFGAYEGPTAVAGDCAANVYILDTGNSRVQKLGPATPASCTPVARVAARASFQARMTTTASTRGAVTRAGATTRERGAGASGNFTGSTPRASEAFRAFARGRWRARYDITMRGGTGTARGTVLATGARRARLCLAFSLRVATTGSKVTLKGAFSTLAGARGVRGTFTQTLGEGFTLRGRATPGRAVRTSLPRRCRALVSG